jgi:hypothetical protein
MIVLIKDTDGNTHKTLIRNHIFQEADETNKKGAALKSNQIRSVYWPTKKGMTEVPIAQWLEMADTQNFWNLG